MAALRISKSLRTKCCLISAGLRSSQLPRYAKVVKPIPYLRGYIHCLPLVAPRSRGLCCSYVTRRTVRCLSSRKLHLSYSEVYFWRNWATCNATYIDLVCVAGVSKKTREQKGTKLRALANAKNIPFSLHPIPLLPHPSQLLPIFRSLACSLVLHFEKERKWLLCRLTSTTRLFFHDSRSAYHLY